ncbi:MAG: site-specific DNA-methyltransferase [Oceanospirillaceae bacterium]|nr:site-specific DNA-methyltransferase [Bacteroidota bacterium]MCP5326781.1 site-specific DNA-methyltransferase [Oceanospirillaceae bacterium]
MKDIPNGSIDMILCDLPYGTTQNKWDSVLDLIEIWEHYTRIIKDNGAIVLTGQSVFSASLIMSQPKLYRYTLIWEKTKAGGFLNAKRMPLQAHEDILVFYKKLPNYNPQMEIGKPYTKKAVTNGDGKNYGKFDRVGQIAVNDGKRYPRSVVKFSNDNHGSLHPTQKPIELFEWLIKTYTNEGDVVLDNTAGSGTTAIACLNTNRHFIVMEQDQKYYEIMCNRIEKHLENGAKKIT